MICKTLYNSIKMKKFNLLIVALLLFGSLYAQQPEKRKPQTVAADVLAVMPASNQDEFNQLMQSVINSGEEAILTVCRQLTPPEKGRNTNAEYLLSGLSYYASKIDEEKGRATVARAYSKALNEIQDNFIKIFIIQQLGITGGNDGVEKLFELIEDESLSQYAANSLSSIRSDDAKNALIQGLIKVESVKTKMAIIAAMGDADVELAEIIVASYFGDYNPEFDKVILNTLSRIGTKASLKLLSTEAAKAGYANDNTSAVASYISLIKRLLAHGDHKTAKTEAVKLLKKATALNQIQYRIAALEIIMMINKSNSDVLKALKDGSPEYRNSALFFASSFANVKLYTELLKYIPVAEPVVKIEIMNWLTKECEDLEKKETLANLKITKTHSITDVLYLQLISTNMDIKQSAANAMSKIGSRDCLVALVQLLLDENIEVINVGKQNLLHFDGSINNEVDAIIKKAGDAGKIAGIELLALRKASSKIETIYGLMESGSPEVSEAAYKALRDFVESSDSPKLCTMLESYDNSVVSYLQQAVITSIETLPKGEKYRRIKGRLDRLSDSKKYIYYPVLSVIEDPEALDILVSAFNTQKGEAKKIAFESLLNRNDFETAQELYAICTDPLLLMYFDKAFENYVRLVSNQNVKDEKRVIYLREAMKICQNAEQSKIIIQEIGKTNSFQALLFAGALLDSPNKKTAAQAIMDIALNNKSFTGDVVKNLLLRVMDILDNPDADYQREAISNHLNEIANDEGFVSIFNGKNLSGWKGLVKNPIERATMSSAVMEKEQKKADEQMVKSWKVENGLLVFDGPGYDNICTQKQYGDFEMYIDWKLDPAGKEPDAGIYLRGTPQVQIWDISRRDVGAQVGSGGLYNNKFNQSKPLMIADNRLGDWNTLYIKMTGDRVSVKLNGQLVVDNVILENYWDNSQPIFSVEQIELQAHGSKVYYRDIYIKELKRQEPFKLSPEEAKEGYKLLFDGTNMHQWIGNTADYIMEDGNIALYPNRGSGGNLYSKNEYSDFVLRFDFQLTPAANNGLGIRTPMVGDAAYVGMELQILDNEHPVYKDLFAYQYHGSVYGVIPAKRGYLKPVGEWNYQEVIAKGNHIKVILNGTVILDDDIYEASENGTIDGYDHPGLLNKKGHIGFLGHGSQVKFRNIRIKEL